MAAVGIAGAFATFVVFAWRDHDEYEVPAEEVARIDARRREAREDLVAGREPGIRLVRIIEREEPVTHGPSQTPGRYGGPAPKRIVTAYGFWVFLLSDFVMFSGFYSAFAVLSHATAGGPGPLELFNLKTVAAETAFLLLSSFACRPRDDRRRGAQHAVDPGRPACDGTARARLSRPRGQRVRQDDRGRQRPRPQRVPVGLLRPRRLATGSTSPSACCGSAR